MNGSDTHKKEQPSAKELKTKFLDANGFLEQEKWKKAEALYKELLEYGPPSVALLCKLASSAIGLKEYSKAESLLVKAENLDPSFIWTYVIRADICQESSNLDKAIFNLKKAQEIDSSLSFLADRITALEKNLSNKVSAKQNDFQQLFQKANNLFEDHELLKAEVIYLKLLNESPSSAPLLCRLADVASKFGRYQQAEEYYNTAEKSDPNFHWTYIGRSELWILYQDYKAAREQLEKAQELAPNLSIIPGRIEKIQQKVQTKKRLKGDVEIIHWPSTAVKRSSKNEQGEPLKVTVVSWDMGHNPLGRAALLAELALINADTELVGPLFPDFGEEIWSPLFDNQRCFDMRCFYADSSSRFIEGAMRLVSEKPADVVWVCKPRLPSLLIGYLYKIIHGSHLICDIDDDELAFAEGDSPLNFDAFLSDFSHSDWHALYANRWIQFAQSLIPFSDGTSVCNPLLGNRFGGELIRHARDENHFDPNRYNRDSLRKSLGYSESDRIVLFMGTPRRHKGLLDIAKALAALNDERIIFSIVGSIPETDFRDELKSFSSLRISFQPNQPMYKAASINFMADLVCIFQNPDDPIAQWQTPAKLTDALAMGVPVIATRVPPLEDFIDAGLVITTDNNNLTKSLSEALEEKNRSDGARSSRRKFFQEELSYKTNAKRAVELFNESRKTCQDVPADVIKLLKFIDRDMPGMVKQSLAKQFGDIFHIGNRVQPFSNPEKGINLVFFWKQNDSGIYGRRQDMLLEELRRSPRINKILHIDAPISIDQLNSISSQTGVDSTNQGALITSSTISRFLRTNDEYKIYKRSFIYRGNESKLFGQELPYKESYPNYVEQWINELDMAENAMAWVCPVVPMFPEVQERIGFSWVVCDVIDDQRQWPMLPSTRELVEENYLKTFAASDLFFTNCEPVAEWLRSEKLNVAVVPNGMEIQKGVENWSTPPELDFVAGPIVGYVGNLHSRIDWDLIEAIAVNRPNWSIILIGSIAEGEQISRVTSLYNVTALGVIPYAKATKYIAAFDAAMIPHTITTLSEKMNPLKLYVYRGLGIRVVSTPVANIGDLSSEIDIADNPDEFILALEN